jgi:DNA-binding XRE family transcriptional regulator
LSEMHLSANITAGGWSCAGDCSGLLKGLDVYPNLKLQLWRSGIRQIRLARLLGVDEAMLSKVINGHRDPSPELRQRISAVLETDVEWLFQPDTLTKLGSDGQLTK